MRSRRFALVWVIAAAAAGAWSCGGAATPTAPSAGGPPPASPPTPAPPTPVPTPSGPTTVTVTPTTLTLAPNASAQVSVALCRGGSCEDCTARAHWDFDAASPVAAVEPGGRVTARGVGDAVLRASCDGPFNYSYVSVRLPEASFSRREDLAGALCGAARPELGWTPEASCPPPAVSTQARHEVDVRRAGWVQLSTSVYGGHDWGDGMLVEVRCGDRLVYEGWSDRTAAFQVDRCRLELKIRNPMIYPQTYRAIVQTP